MVSYQERRRPWGYRRHADFVPHAGVTLGNVHTEASLGGTLRLGLPLPDDFGPWHNAPATSARTRFDLYVFARVEGGGPSVAQMMAPSLSTVRLPLREMGRRGFDAAMTAFCRSIPRT